MKQQRALLVNNAVTLGVRKAAVFFVNCFLVCLLFILLDPRAIGFEHGVEDGEHFAHAGDDYDFEWFMGLSESLGEGFDGVVGSHGGDGGHVESVSDLCSSASDTAGTSMCAAIYIEWRDAYQGSDLSVVEGTEFGQVGQDGESCDISDTRNAFKDIAFSFEFLIGLNCFGQQGLDFVDEFIELFDKFADCLFDALDGSGFEMLFFEFTQFHQLSSAREQL